MRAKIRDVEMPWEEETVGDVNGTFLFFFYSKVEENILKRKQGNRNVIKIVQARMVNFLFLYDSYNKQFRPKRN